MSDLAKTLLAEVDAGADEWVALLQGFVRAPTPKTMAAADENIEVEEFLHVLRVHALAAARYLMADG